METNELKVTREQYEEAKKQVYDAEQIISQYHKQEIEEFKERCASGRPFTLDELRFSAFAKCPCGSGLAYPVKCGPSGYWDCADILMGKEDKTKTHTDKLYFAFYEIKSEDQPSAKGATTRPTKEKTEA